MQKYHSSSSSFYIYNQVKISKYQGLSNDFNPVKWFEWINILIDELTQNNLIQYRVVKQFINIFLVGTIIRTIGVSSMSSLAKLPKYLSIVANWQYCIRLHRLPPGASYLLTLCIKNHGWHTLWILLRFRKYFFKGSSVPFWCIS